MKKVLLIISMFTSLVLAGLALATTHDFSDSEDTFQPAQADDVFPFNDQFAARETVEPLLQKLKNPDPFVRVEAIQSLGEIPTELSLVSVCGSLNDKNLYVRAYAAEAVGKIGRLDMSLSLLSLLTALDDPSPYVRSMMLSALGELQDTRAVDSIRKLLDDEDESVRNMAAWALENIKKAE